MTFENIAVPQVAPQFRRAPYFSWPYFIFAFFRILEYLIPLIIVMFTNEMWKKTGEFVEMAQVDLSENYLILLRGKNDYLYSSSFPVLNGAEVEHFRIIHQEHYWEDLPDHRILHLNIKMPTDGKEISILTYFLYFHYNLEYHSIVKAELPVFDTILIPANTSKINFYGSLNPDQNRPLKTMETFQIVNKTRKDVEHYKPDEVLLRLTGSPLNLKLGRKTRLIQTRASNTLELNFNIIVLPCRYTYQSGILDLLKWFWIQFLCLYILMRYILDSFFSYLNSAQYDF
ncbi:unnamed protein product [Auanema sp. JU1783]|nr:unnamed protein product [Auanema sp. JU1783]